MKRLVVLLVAMVTTLAAFASPAVSAPGAAPGRANIDTPAAAGQLVVKFQPGLAASGRAKAAADLGGRILSKIDALDTDVLEFPALKAGASAQAIQQILAALKANPNVVYAAQLHL